MFFLHRKAHKQGSIKKQAPTWGDSVRVTHRGTSAGCPLPALCQRLQGTAHTRARTDPLPNSAQLDWDMGAGGSSCCSAFSRWESMSTPRNLREGLMQPCRGSGGSFPGSPPLAADPSPGC